MSDVYDIVSLIKSDSSVIDNHYDNHVHQNRLIHKLKEVFTSEEEKIFMASFTCYTQFNPYSDFVILLNDIWKWLGYSRFEECKRALLKHFKENVDYKIEKAAPPIGGAKIEPLDEQEKDKRGGHNKEYITLTVNCFKKLCLKSRTEQAEKIHDYYIKLEQSIHQVMKEEINELRNQLILKNNEIDNVVYKNEQNLLIKHDKKRCFYLILISSKIIKFGITSDIIRRLKDHKREISENIVLLYVLETVYNTVIENKIKELCNNSNDILYETRMTMEFNDKIQTELISLENITVEQLWNKVLQIEKNINKDEIFMEMERKIELLTVELEQMKDKVSILKEPKKVVKTINLLEEDVVFPILNYHINTKETIKLDTLADAKRFYGVDAQTIKNYVNKRRQLNGYVLRTHNKYPYWMPPENFKYNGIVKQTTQNVFIKRIDKITDEVTYYNSITEAAIFLQFEIDNIELDEETHDCVLIKKALGELFRGLPTRKEIIVKYRWYKMKEIGYMVNEDSSTTCIDEEIPISTENTELALNNDIVIVRNIDTGEETMYPEGYSSKFYKVYGMRKETYESHVNTPHNYKNFTFRTGGMPYWNPPKTYMRNKQSDNARVNYYLKAINLKTDEVSYHHSINDLVLNLFPNDDKIKTASAIHKKLYSGRNPTILTDYDIIKLETCGEWVYPNGDIENIEKLWNK